MSSDYRMTHVVNLFYNALRITVFFFFIHVSGAHVQFQNFSSEDNHDFLEVRAGPQHSSALIGQFTGSQIPPPLLSTTHLTVIHFYSDHSENRQGFKLTYQGEFEFRKKFFCALFLSALDQETNVFFIYERKKYK